MPFVTRKSLVTLTLLAVGIGLAIGGFVWSGLYDIGADDPHTRPVHALLESLREHSIETRAAKLQPPDLSDPERIIQGAGNYNAMCMGCHLAPGMADTELSKGLYPSPPNLTKTRVDVAEAFWVIKHGIKASGMPAWGRSMADEYVWSLAAFVHQLPTLDARQYQAMVDRSAGHSHGGGETRPHAHGGEPVDENRPHGHPPGTAADHHGSAPTKPAATKAAPAMVEHRHADGTVESHPAPQGTPTDDHRR